MCPNEESNALGIQKYLITSREFYIVHKQLKKHNPTYALYRDKSNSNYSIQAAHFVEICNQFETIKSFIHQDEKLAKKLNATGVHLTSKQFDKIQKAKKLGLEVIISTHTHEDVLNAQKLGADGVTYGPIFNSPGKGKPKDVDDLRELLKKCDINVFALGGIVEDSHVQKIEETGVYGFASIRYFK
jgi:thiamine-phosphate pyrophosphorylase